MNKKLLQGRIFQLFIFNIVVFIIFIILIINYFIPKFYSIEDKKNNLQELQLENNKLLNRGIDYGELKKLYYKSKIKSEYYDNLLLSFSEEDYNKNFINNGKGKYLDFIKNKKIEIKKDKERIEKTGVLEKLKKVLPYYISDGSYNKDGLSDFAFINYMENILHNFHLSYKGDLGIGNIKVEEIDNFEKELKSKNNNLEGEIYSFILPLNIIGSKKDIINFIYYLENVGYIHFVDGDNIEIEEFNKEKSFIDKNGNIIKNNFLDLEDYFENIDDIFNHIAVNIEKIELKDYLDSSGEPISYDEGETFIGFIKKDQSDEMLELNLEIKFFVKGIEKYQIKKEINLVISEYEDLKKTILSGIKFGEKNKGKLTKESLLSLKELRKYNLYLMSLKKDIGGLSDLKKIKTDLGNIYKKSQSYKKVFENIDRLLDIHLKNVSEKIYKNYKNKKIKNDK